MRIIDERPKYYEVQKGKQMKKKTKKKESIPVNNRISDEVLRQATGQVYTDKERQKLEAELRHMPEKLVRVREPAKTFIEGRGVRYTDVKRLK